MSDDNWLVKRFKVLDSTNIEASRIARHSLFVNLWILAEQQNLGKGRLGRTWMSPQGNLYATALFKEPNGLHEATRVPFIASIAVADTIIALCPGIKVNLKWPNDVFVDNAKICGILVETGKCGDSEFWVACGIGINVNVAPRAAEQSVTCLSKECDRKNIDIDSVFIILKERFESRLKQSKINFQKIVAVWRSMAIGLNKLISVRIGNKTVDGIFKDIEDDGALRLILPDGRVQIVRAGDVSVVKEPLIK